MTNRKKVLITGCSGLVGTFAVSRFLRDNFKYEVVGVDLQDYPIKINSLYGHRFTFLKMDLTDTKNLIDLFDSNNFDLVINLFGVKGSPMRAKNSPVDFLYPSLKINTEIINQCAKRNIWLVFVSSVGVYSPAEKFVEEDVWKTLPSENDWYPSWSKRIGELLLEAYKVQYGYNKWSIIRPANIFGDYDDFSGNGTVISSTIKKIYEATDSIECWGDGSPTRDFVYGKDVAEAIVKMYEDKINDVVNFGSGEEITIKTMIENLISISGKDIEIKWDPTKPNGDLRRQMDITKQEKYGLLPKTSFKDALKKTYYYYTSQFPIEGINFNVRKFITEGGFYFGKTEEIIKNNEEFQEMIDLLKKDSNDKSNYQYRFDYIIDGEDSLGYSPIYNNQEMINEREKYVKEKGGREVQRWWEMMKFGSNSQKAREYFQKIVEDYIPKIYPELKDNIDHQDNFTLYENGDHITPHNDGENSARYCVIIIYLSDKNDYNNGGGELEISEYGTTVKLSPVNDNFSILDFTRNNPNHSVLRVGNDFRRFAYINFVHNKKMVNEQKLRETKQNII
jgi:GDP-L-fucose synthase